jgi:hypothetical protein
MLPGIRENPMSDLTDCRGMEQLYRERAKADPVNGGKWLGQAERWRDLGKQENAWRLQKRSTQQQAHAGPMATQPRPVESDRRWKQMG